jgi:S-adenosyl-L-methionine hydrolase (adenosine-forming)
VPLLTLTSDIGSPDYLVGAVKAQLLQLNADFQIIDISHNIPPFNYPQAAYVCRSAIKNFPDFSYRSKYYWHFIKTNTCYVQIMVY